MRRLVESVVAGAVLAILSPLLAVVSAMIKRDSPGPVIFRQQRVGLRGETFDILKFRTMRASEDGAQVTASGDPRITRVGQWLRSTKLDELPQLVNVVRGEMGLVGPRPELPRFVAQWPEQDRDLLLSVRPGITDPASIVFRRESELLAAQADPERYYVDVLLPQKVGLYRDYVDRRSVGTDVVIVLRTLASVVRS